MKYLSKESNLQMISDLSNAKGVSGFEDQVVEAARSYSEGLGRIKEDSLRNLFIYRKENTGGRPVVQLDAHSDEVGFMVQSIRPNGCLQIAPLGSWITSNIPATKVWVRNSEGEYIPGIVGSKPPHFMSEAEKKSPLDFRQLQVDIGARSMEEAVNDFKIRIGEPIVPYAEFTYNHERDVMMGKAFDNRLGCAGVISTLRALEGQELKVDVAAGIASQEEVGARGSVITSRVIKPNVALVFEGCPADDTFLLSYDIQTALKKGPMLRHMDAKMITNYRFQRFALDLAAQKGLQVQEAIRTGGSTNAAAIHLSNEGVPTIVIGVPVRYAHTHYGISSYFDFDISVKLACEILQELDEDMIRSF
jgi:putative aminopeptidase FrvX